jgi:two-component system sensor histidine kinase HydH
MGAATQSSSFDASQRMEELGRIILAYSDVTEKLQRSQEQLTRTVQSLRAELSEKNRQLERRNRLAALGEMAAGLAHEIRNPLGAIQLYASVLTRDLEGREQPLATVKKISGGVKRLEALVTQVLQFTREMRSNITRCDLAAVVDQAVDLAEPLLQDHGVICKVDGPRPMDVEVDPLLIGQALLNLLRNAVEASGTGSAVHIRFAQPPADSDARQFHLVVLDAGPGIAADALDRIFNPFFTTKDDGTGLGLAIVHRVVEAHDGTILVTNPPDGGAKFEIRI